MEVPILAISGFSTQLRPELLKQFANVAMLRKPFSHHELATNVRTLLDRAAAPASERTPG